MRSRILIFLALGFAACGDMSSSPDAAQRDAPARTCSQTGPATTSGMCDWKFDCSDFNGTSPEYLVHCEGTVGGNYTCTCTIGVVQTNTITLPDACTSTTAMCMLANSGCGWDPKITCIQ